MPNIFALYVKACHPLVANRVRNLDEKLCEHVERVKDALEENSDIEKIVEQVIDSTNSLIREPLVLAPESLKTPVRGYGRNLLYHDPDYDFVVVAMVWPPLEETSVHDHGTWGVVGVNEGQLNVTNYSREDDGTFPGIAILNELDTISAGEGMATHVFPPEEDIHKVWNSTTDISVSIHTYGKPIYACNTFDLEEGAFEEMKVSYTS